MRLIIILIAFLSSLNAKPLPTIPENCFNENLYCSSRKIVKSNVEGKVREVIRVELFAVVSTDEWESYVDVVERFTDFTNWTKYTTIEYESSLILSDVIDNGKRTIRHYANYYSPAPFPVNKIHLREVAEYVSTDDFPESNSSFYFKTITNETFNIPGEETLKGAENIQYKAGTVNVREDADEGLIYIYYTIETIPGIDIMLNLSSKFVEKSIIEVLVGLYDL